MSWEWELSRLVMALAVGSLLSFSGSLIQHTTRNELASASTLGLDGMAVLCVLLGVSLKVFFPYPLGLLTLVAGVVVVSTLLLARRMWSFVEPGKFHGDLRGTILLGLGINLLMGALFSFLQFLAMAFNREFPGQLWFGRISSPQAASGLTLIPLLAAVAAFLRAYRRSWKTLLLGRSWCLLHGLDQGKIVRRSILLSFLITLWVAAFFGIFSFLGLLAPVLLRQMKVFSGEPWREMSVGALLSGGVFSLLDHACYNWTFDGAEIPVGLVTSCLGALALIFVLLQRANSQR